MNRLPGMTYRKIRNGIRRGRILTGHFSRHYRSSARRPGRGLVLVKVFLILQQAGQHARN